MVHRSDLQQQQRKLTEQLQPQQQQLQQQQQSDLQQQGEPQIATIVLFIYSIL